MTKYIFVTGGVVSSLGKGISASSIGKLLQARGLKVSMLKCDPYINVDPGTMNPKEHGEVFVLDDGGEVDMDFGHYERFLGVNCKFSWNLTMGKIYKTILDRERLGDFLGQTVQLIPHVTDAIKAEFHRTAREEKADIVIIEIGGTVGDIESMPFLEAVRQLRREVGGEAFCVFVHTTLVPVMTITGLQLGGLIAFAIITETVFQWPGMGLLFIQAVTFADIPVMAAYLCLIALIFVVINLVVDLLYFAVDPRLRVGKAGGH